jgi:hypothetical protein
VTRRLGKQGQEWVADVGPGSFSAAALQRRGRQITLDSVHIGWSIPDSLKPPPGGSTASREGSPIKVLLFAP